MHHSNELREVDRQSVASAGSRVEQHGAVLFPSIRFAVKLQER
jgi:hypothetical protein